MLIDPSLVAPERRKTLNLTVFSNSTLSDEFLVVFSENGDRLNWPQQTWTEKWGLLCSFPWGSTAAGSPSNTMWPGPRPTSVGLPSAWHILMHPTVWPQLH